MLDVETGGTGVPVRASQTAGRPGKGEDGKAGTREVKLARLFTVSALDADGGPVMDPGSSSYTFTFGGKDALADLVKAEYLRRGGGHHRQVVALGDGAAWIWTMAGDLYPSVILSFGVSRVRDLGHRVADSVVDAMAPALSGVFTGLDRYRIGSGLSAGRRAPGRAGGGAWRSRRRAPGCAGGLR